MAISDNSNIIEKGKILLKQENYEIPVCFYEKNLQRIELPWHWQDSLEICIVNKGQVEVSVEAERYLLNEGEGFFINSGALNACRQLPETSGECLIRSVVFDPRNESEEQESLFFNSYIAPLFSGEAFKGTALMSDVAWHKEILRLAGNLWNSSIEESDADDKAAIATMSQMVFLLSSHSAAEPRVISSKDTRDAERIRVMLSYIDEHYRDDLNVSVLSESAEISESEAMRCFHNMLGTTPIQYVKNYRIRKAAELLQVSDEKIVDIAIDCGFQDMSYFAKTFRESKGITPTDYREKYKQ
ncbi:AraC family transcriptional regulator [Oribacterium sp. P6A1]|uniref:AraC family transcriptional regulator n=1 Tax=Oribacterium sp. P6A1 TaxID=1410612 RepID=UPI000561B9A7|nr:AraC family transcriptional regulator [Oribacterium sp. P6A1]